MSYIRRPIHPQVSGTSVKVMESWAFCPSETDSNTSAKWQLVTIACCLVASASYHKPCRKAVHHHAKSHKILYLICNVFKKQQQKKTKQNKTIKVTYTQRIQATKIAEDANGQMNGVAICSHTSGAFQTEMGRRLKIIIIISWRSPCYPLHTSAGSRQRFGLSIINITKRRGKAIACQHTSGSSFWKWRKSRNDKVQASCRTGLQGCLTGHHQPLWPPSTAAPCTKHPASSSSTELGGGGSGI